MWSELSLEQNWNCRGGIEVGNENRMNNLEIVDCRFS